MLNIKLKSLRFALLCAISAFGPITASAQKVTYDWSGNSKTADAPRITRTQPVKFEIQNVNDILFSYKLEVTQKSMDFDDFGLIKKLIPNLSPATHSGNSCGAALIQATTKLKFAADQIDKDPKLPVGYAASAQHISISLNDSKNAWNTLRGGVIQVAIDKAEAAIQVCPSSSDLLKTFVSDSYNPFKKKVDSITAKVNSPHVFEDTHELSPGSDVTATVYEKFNNETIGSKTFSFSVGDILTLSAGALFSRIPDRSYQARKTPGSTDNVLAVEGNSRLTPGVVALLHYSLGALHPKLDGDNVGLALSAGPIVRFGSQGSTTSFGFFTGVSAHLYHRFYFTPGFHFGQFADFPVGFHNGSTIPANFGELNPLKRWTGRFGFAITFKAKDFKSLEGNAAVTGETSGGSSPAASPSPSPAASPSPSPADSPSPSPSPNGDSSTNLSADRTVAMKDPNPSSTRGAAESEKPRPSTIHISSLNIIETPRGERLVIDASSPITDYTFYARAGRFYLVIPAARLDTFQSGLRGRIINDARVERRGVDLILSFDIAANARAQIAEGPFGLDLMFYLSRGDPGSRD
jgi:hypothetical protein